MQKEGGGEVQGSETRVWKREENVKCGDREGQQKCESREEQRRERRKKRMTKNY